MELDAETYALLGGEGLDVHDKQEWLNAVAYEQMLERRKAAYAEKQEDRQRRKKKLTDVQQAWLLWVKSEKERRRHQAKRLKQVAGRVIDGRHRELADRRELLSRLYWERRAKGKKS